MVATNFSGPIYDHNGNTANPGDSVILRKNVTVSIVNGVASGSFSMPSNASLALLYFDTLVTIPGTPTALNLRLGSAANGQQYVADVDVKAQGYIEPAILYAARNNPGTVFFAVSTVGGTPALQVGTVVIRVNYSYTA